jgi:hypothetical protein
MRIHFRRIETCEWDAIVKDLASRCGGFSVTWCPSHREDRHSDLRPNVVDVTAAKQIGIMCFGMRYYPGISFETRDVYAFDAEEFMTYFTEWHETYLGKVIRNDTA